jgi:hypothetical protein
MFSFLFSLEKNINGVGEICTSRWRRRRRRRRSITMVNGRESVGEERTVTTREHGDHFGEYYWTIRQQAWPCGDANVPPYILVVVVFADQVEEFGGD